MRWRHPDAAGGPGDVLRVGGAAYSGSVSRSDETFLDLALSRSTVDRSAALRADTGAVVAALADGSTRVLTLQDGAAPVRPGPPPRLDLRPPRPGDESLTPWLLGVREGVTYLAVDQTPPDGAPPAPEPVPASDDGVRVTWQSLREVGAELDDTDAGLLTTATALAEWHRRHGHCPRCGSRTTIEQGGWVRRCPVDGSEHHPRTDPAVIMAVTDPAYRLLLATGVHWPEGRVSVLAGFVEAGESLEAAVAREVKEEAGLTVTAVSYRGNQPWPFPASLMVGYRARVELTDLTLDPGELRSADWYTQEELGEAVSSGRLTLPTRVSIARRLIEEWFGGPVPEPGGSAR